MPCSNEMSRKLRTVYATVPQRLDNRVGRLGRLGTVHAIPCPLATCVCISTPHYSFFAGTSRNFTVFNREGNCTCSCLRGASLLMSREEVALPLHG